MLKNPRDGITPDKPGEVGPIKLLEELKAKGHPVAYVGDVVGTGSSRKSATNSVIWHTGEDIPFVPNKRFRRRMPGWQNCSYFLQYSRRLRRIAD